MVTMRFRHFHDLDQFFPTESHPQAAWPEIPGLDLQGSMLLGVYARQHA